jgi:hypothetical protein
MCSILQRAICGLALVPRGLRSARKPDNKRPELDQWLQPGRGSTRELEEHPDPSDWAEGDGSSGALELASAALCRSLP